jgi:hypothetical protein
MSLPALKRRKKKKEKEISTEKAKKKKKKMEEKLTKKEDINESVGVFNTGRSTEIEKAKKKKTATNSSKVERIKINYEINVGGDEGDDLGDEIVNRVIERMNEELGHDVLKNGSNGPKVLNLNILQCTKGSRWTRIFVFLYGGLLVSVLLRAGWIVLEVEWELIDEKGCVLVKGASTLCDSAAIGIFDMFERGYGKKTLLNKLTPKLAGKIKAKSLPFL